VALPAFIFKRNIYFIIFEMKFDISVKDWGEHVFNYTTSNLEEAVGLILSAAENHPGAHVNVCIGEHCVLMDMALSPDVEANLMKLERQALKSKQREAAKKTNTTLKKKNPNHYRDAALKRWAKFKK
jgi:hypothetical protein